MENEENVQAAVTEAAATVESTTESVEDILSDFQGIFGTADAAQTGPAAEAQPEAIETAPAVPTETESPREETSAEEEVPKQLSPLLAKSAAAERAHKAEIEALKTQAESLKAEARKELISELMNNPQQFITAHELAESAGDLALHFYAADLGDEAPADLKAQVGISEVDRVRAEAAAQIEALRQEIQQREIHARNEATLNQYQGFISEVPTGTHPLLAAEASNDANEVLSTMAQVADAVYGRTGSYPSAPEVAAMIERELSTAAERYNSVLNSSESNVENPQKAVPAKEEETETQTKTLSVSHSGKAAASSPVGEDELFADALAFYKEHMS